jgi:hypothetical protein
MPIRKEKSMETEDAAIKIQPGIPPKIVPAGKEKYHPAKSKWSNWSSTERPGRNVPNNDTNRLPNQRPG